MKNLSHVFKLNDFSNKNIQAESYTLIANCKTYNRAKQIDYDEKTNTVILGYTYEKLKQEMGLHKGVFPLSDIWINHYTNELVFNIKVITVKV